MNKAVKALTAVALSAAVACLAACGDQKERFEEPPTETVTLESGETEVFEVVTDESGEAVTDSDGLRQTVKYDPPVTDGDGFIVTNAEGNTRRQSQTKMGERDVEIVDIDQLDDTTAVSKADGAAGTTSGKTERSGSDKKDGAAEKTDKKDKAEGTPAAQYTEKETTKKEKTTKEKTTKEKAETTAYEFPYAQPVTITGLLSDKKAQKLLDILDFTNEFEAALLKGDFDKANSVLPVYIQDIKIAASAIRTDPALLEFVTEENLENWVKYADEITDKYKLFYSIYTMEKDNEKKSGNYENTYKGFQKPYASELLIYYEMKNAAQKFA